MIFRILWKQARRHKFQDKKKSPEHPKNSSAIILFLSPNNVTHILSYGILYFPKGQWFWFSKRALQSMNRQAPSDDTNSAITYYVCICRNIYVQCIHIHSIVLVSTLCLWDFSDSESMRWLHQPQLIFQRGRSEIFVINRVLCFLGKKYYGLVRSFGRNNQIHSRVCSHNRLRRT